MIEQNLVPEKIARGLHPIMGAANDLPLHDAEQIESLIRVGVRAVVFENLCTQIHEYETTPLSLGDSRCISALA
jgi:hypothetical protein